MYRVVQSTARTRLERTVRMEIQFEREEEWHGGETRPDTKGDHAGQQWSQTGDEHPVGTSRYHGAAAQEHRDRDRGIEAPEDASRKYLHGKGQRAGQTPAVVSTSQRAFDPPGDCRQPD